MHCKASGGAKVITAAILYIMMAVDSPLSEKDRNEDSKERSSFLKGAVFRIRWYLAI